MSGSEKHEQKPLRERFAQGRFIKTALGVLFFFGVVVAISSVDFHSVTYERADAKSIVDKAKELLAPAPTLDKDAYNKKLLTLAHINIASTTTVVSTTTPKGYTLISPATATFSVSAPKNLWPVRTVYPNAGALLPFNRIVAYYGNFYSKGMGVLGQYPEDDDLARLMSAVKEWQAADPATPVIPAIHYIVETAQGSAQKDGTYRLQMPDSQIDHALEMANKVHGIVFIDFQVGKSTIEKDLPAYVDYLKLPNVHLGVDPEFSMKDGSPPGRVIGTMDAADINYAANFLAALVKANNLPPKILVVHRFTEDMVTNYKKIAPLPEVEIVMDMDGWGFGAKKINTYNSVIYPEPVQFTGFKLFYKNDLLPPSTAMLTPAQILKLTPAPSYIQYQ
jgi:hypothetical protein